MRGSRLQVKNDNAFDLERLMTKCVHDSISDVHAFASADKKLTYILLWNYYDDDISGTPAKVNLQLSAIPVTIINYYKPVQH